MYCLTASTSTDMSTENKTFDIIVNGEKKGIAYDSNPITVDTDEQCKIMLTNLRDKLKLSAEQLQLIEQCISVTLAGSGEDIPFGPGEIVDLSLLAMSFPESANEIMACSHHLCESMDCDGELPIGIFSNLAQAHGFLGNALNGNLDDDDSSDESDESD